MSSNVELLEQIHAKGAAAAQRHFEDLIRCANAALPDGVKETIPKTPADVAGLFSASTKDFFLIILRDTPGYESMDAVFQYSTMVGWELKKFSVLIGCAAMFQQPKEYTATCIEDALVLSRQINAFREKYAAENPAIPSFPDMSDAKPN